MAEYHKYVFDHKARTFIGKFEEMYQQETVSNFDSWHQEDSRQLNRNIALAILDGYNFETVLDIGAGKGALTHHLKKRNNRVVGLDISPTAVSVAQSRFPDIEFDVVDVNDVRAFDAYFGTAFGSHLQGSVVNLVFSAECLSFIENWRNLINSLHSRTRYLMIILNIPDEPIGFIKNPKILEEEVRKYFEIIESVLLQKSQFIVLLCENLSLKRN
jgi:2-polyprenyl-3-methyl-5-hydroxy-6-metoxy-1,4-benzoquinol methylase